MYTCNGCDSGYMGSGYTECQGRVFFSFLSFFFLFTLIIISCLQILMNVLILHVMKYLRV